MDKQRNERRFLTRYGFFVQSSAADEIHDSKFVSRLKNFRETIDWENEAERDQFRRQLNLLIKNWKGQLPNLREIFRIKEIDWLLAESVKSDDYLTELEPLINFVIRAGYKDEPKIDRHGRPLPRRTTAVHPMFEDRIVYDGGLIRKLFKIYNRFDVNYTDEFGLTHFHVACKHGCKNVVDKFLKHGLNPNCIVSETVDSPLHLALEANQKKIIKLLLRRGANPNLANKKAMTSLHIVCKSNDDNVELAKMLFELSDEKYHPLHINGQDKLGNTPIHLALQKGHKMLVELLLRRGSDTNLANKEGLTPLHIICNDNPDNEELVKMLFELSDEKYHPVQVNAQDKLGKTPLHVALCNDKNKVAEWLLRIGASPNLADKEGSVPLHIIFKKNIDDTEKMFFDAKRKKDIQQQKNEQQKNIIELLLRTGADPNLANTEGLTPLHIFCKNFYADHDLLRLFFKINDEIQQTVQIDARDKLGRTPLQLAVANLLPDRVDILLDRGDDLSSFVFPTVITMSSCFKELDCKLVLASGALAVVESLEEKGYDLDQSDALTIITFFVECKVFEKSIDLKQSCYDDTKFVTEAKDLMVIPSLSLYDLMQLRPEEAAKQLTIKDYFEFARSYTLSLLLLSHADACVLHLCEMMSRRYVRRWALYPFWELIHYRLPILCCDMILDELTNEDLCNICLATTIQSS